MKPSIFIASSVESLQVARAVQANLERDAIVTVWDQGAFQPSEHTMESLDRLLRTSGFAVCILAPDDHVVSRGQPSLRIRDNVVMELGLFIGRLGRSRCFGIVARPHGDLSLPSDVLGINWCEYDSSRADGNLHAALSVACDRIRSCIAKLGHSAARELPTDFTMASVQVIQFEGEARELTSLPRDSTQKVLYPRLAYKFVRGVLRLSPTLATMSADVTISLNQDQVSAGTLRGYGPVESGACYARYRYEDPIRQQFFIGLAVLSVSGFGEMNGHWMSDDFIERGTLSMGDLRLWRTSA